jgi:hypothetical protein
MTLLDPAAQSASLDNDYGATKGPNAPASLEVALFTDDPLLGGVELAATGGYARVVVPNDGTTWPAAASGGSKTSAQVSFGTSTDAWSDVAAWFVLFDHADGVTRWDAQELTDEIVVTAAGTPASVQMTVYYDNTGA